MPMDFKLPELGENIESGDLVKILVSVGQQIAKDQAVVELETDKATIEVPSPAAGRVKAIHVKEGDKVKVGQLILTVDDKDGTKAAEAQPHAPAAGVAAETATSAEQRRPEPAEKPRTEVPPAEPSIPPGGDGSGKIEAEAVEADQPVSGTPAQSEQPSPPSHLGRPATPERAQAAEAVAPEAKAEPAAPAAAPEAPGRVAPAAPSVRRHARELGIDINRVPGSGPAGRISEADVTRFARAVIQGIEGAGRAGLATAAPLPDFSRWGEIGRKPMSNIRRKTAEHLAQAWSTIPHVTQHDRADITRLEELRRQFAGKAESAGGKLTITAIAVKVIASALRVFPQFAASVDVRANEIVYKKYCHIGVAVDTDRGLLVPVIRDADRKNIIELAGELGRLAEKARAKKLAPDEMEGGVFTITNLGGIGGTSFSPIVNAPEVAILGISRSSMEPVYANGLFSPCLMLPLSLSYDHRLIDGADAARFLRWVVEALEQPFLLSLEG